MAIEVEEKVDSRRVSVGSSSTAELKYVVEGSESDTDADAATALEAYSPVIFDVFGNGILVLPRAGMDLDPVCPGLWDGVVKYGSGTPNDERELAFDIGAGSQHITQSLQTIKNYAPSGITAPNHYGAIGVSNGSIEGVDIVVPQFNLSETYTKASADVTLAYLSSLSYCTGKVNDAAFRGWYKGNVLFKGATGRRRGWGAWEITYQFSVSLERQDPYSLTIGDITGIEKEGWQYLWVEYEDTEDETAKRMSRRPIAAHVEQVYEYADFALLEIGTD